MKFISFNSYKGGACRTTTCYNTLPYLAKKLGATSKNPIIVYDADLDSMGLTSLFHANRDKSDDKKRLPYSARNLFIEDESGMITRKVAYFTSVQHDEWFFKHFEKVGEHLGLEDDGAVLFCGVDTNAPTITDDQYKQFADNAPIFSLYRALNLTPAAGQPKAVIFDCAAGVQMSTLRVLMVVARSVLCMRPTTQFRMGTEDYLLNWIPEELSKALDRPEIILLPTSVADVRVPDSDPNCKEAVNELKKMRKKAFLSIQSDIIFQFESEKTRRDLRCTLNSQMIDIANDEVGIPEIERFKWEEGEKEDLLFRNPHALTEREKYLKQRYEKLADLLARD